MRKRFQLGNKRSKRMFTKSASFVHPRNVLSGAPMRGGIRL